MDARVSKAPPRRRKNKKAAAEPPLTGPASIHDVPDDLLKLTLLRLDSSLWLIRAASVCKRWRGVIVATDDGAGPFLRLSRALHPPAIVGHYHLGRDPAAFVPTSPPAIDGGRFSSLGFLPDEKATWEVADCHGGLVLLYGPGRYAPDLIVCDPLTRQHQGIIHPRGVGGYSFAGASLLDGEDGGISMSNFRVLYRFDLGHPAYVFTMAEGGDWRPLEGDDLEHLGMPHHVAGRVDGSLCLGLEMAGEAIALDNDSLEFYQINLPTRKGPSVSEEGFSTFRVVHASGGVARIVHVYGDELEVFRQVDVGGRGWVMERSIPRMSEATRELPGYPRKRFDWILELHASGAGFVVLSVLALGRRWLFSVDVETMEMAVVPEKTYHGATCPYTLPWPPLLQACTGKSRRRRR
ncbi:hypothetical protein ACP70R_029312 [Stipagrostis hirtigluma subsp. patula]